MIILPIIGGIAAVYLLSGIRVVNQTERGVKETLGKYSRFVNPGFNFVFPLFQAIHKMNITEQMSNIESERDYITKDKLNTEVDLVVFYKIKADEKNVKNAFYNVGNVEDQIITLAQTTARDVIGGMDFKEVNSERNLLNQKLRQTMIKETQDWGVDIVRVELKAINPPKDVQESMNRVIKAQNEKQAAIDFATATETEADGKKRAAIKEAEGLAQGKKIVADANAYKTKVENEASEKYFKPKAQKFKELETVQVSLANNSKIILGQNSKDVLKLFNLDK